MKKIEKIGGRLKILFILLIMKILVVSCDFWLDVVPDNLPTINDAFSNRSTAQRSLVSCYRYLPDPVHPFYYPAYYINKDEFDLNYNPVLLSAGRPVFTLGISGQNTNNPQLDYWGGRTGVSNLFQAIRVCNLFLEGIHQPQDIEEMERNRWIAEVKFLKAYYHFFLMQLYGPVPVIKESLPISASPDEVRVYREPVDECIDYIVQLIDEAAPDLPNVITDNSREDGRITRPIALAVKAKVLVWGASPLFNGNSDYRNWRDSRDKLLISDTYDPEKWRKAATAIGEAIDNCHEAGHELYMYDRASGLQRMNDSLILTMHTRKAITDRWNEGVVWSSTEAFKPGYQNREDLQRTLFPVMFSQDVTKVIASCYASFNMAELFYTHNGIPIDEDPSWDYGGRYLPKTSTEEEGNGFYIALGQQTASLNFNREPRFYGSLCFDRGYLELSTGTTDYGVSFSPYMAMRYGEQGTSSNFTGYIVKKLIAFETSCSQGALDREYNGYDYRFPLLRLADLYLLYSEALNEVKDVPDGEVFEWIDRVRAITGLKGVVESWSKSKYPDRPFNKNEMRKIIQQERLIELAFEGQRFWDMRRWKLAENSWSYVPKGWNVTGGTVDEYYTVVKVGEARNYTFREYLWPIHIYDLRINPNLVQTYGW